MRGPHLRFFVDSLAEASTLESSDLGTSGLAMGLDRDVEGLYVRSLIMQNHMGKNIEHDVASALYGLQFRVPGITFPV